MEFLDKKTIKLEKVPTTLDKFIFRFAKILQKHTKYVIVSGYVSILFGRARSTEDIDILIEKMSEKKFSDFYSDVTKSGYWCLNSKDKDEIFKMLLDGLSVRFAEKRKIIPNAEIKFIKNNLEREILRKSLKIITSLGQIKISPIEQQIAFKELILASDKDKEDAKHLEIVFKDKINKKLLEKYRRLFKNERFLR